MQKNNYKFIRTSKQDHLFKKILLLLISILKSLFISKYLYENSYFWTGGFIGGHLSKRLKLEGHEVVGADIKLLEFCQNHCDKSYVFDLKN